jgi:hypothetical protein
VAWCGGVRSGPSFLGQTTSAPGSETPGRSASTRSRVEGDKRTERGSTRPVAVGVHWRMTVRGRRGQTGGRPASRLAVGIPALISTQKVAIFSCRLHERIEEATTVVAGEGHRLAVSGDRPRLSESVRAPPSTRPPKSHCMSDEVSRIPPSRKPDNCCNTYQSWLYGP